MISQNSQRSFVPNSTAREILAAAELNARASSATLARETGYSEQLVKYHLRSAVDAGFISGMTAVIDPEALGYTMYIVYLRFFGASRAQELKWQESCAKVPGVMAIVHSFGRWNGFVAVWARSPAELESLLTLITQSMAGSVEEMQVTTRLNSHYGTLSILSQSRSRVMHSLESRPERVQIDNYDLQILNHLAQDSRITTTKLSSLVRLSPATVKDRIAGLEQRRIIIGYRALYQYSMLGFTQYRVLFKLMTPSQHIYSRIMDELFNTGQVHLVTRYLGFADFDARCFALSLGELDQLLVKIRDRFVNDIAHYDVVPLLRVQYVSHLPIRVDS